MLAQCGAGVVPPEQAAAAQLRDHQPDELLERPGQVVAASTKPSQAPPVNQLPICSATCAPVPTNRGPCSRVARCAASVRSVNVPGPTCRRTPCTRPRTPVTDSISSSVISSSRPWPAKSWLVTSDSSASDAIGCTSRSTSMCSFSLAWASLSPTTG